MRWPFVSRAAYDSIVASRDLLHAMYQHERAMVMDEWKRYDELLDRYHALRLQGQTVTPPRPDIQPAPPSPVEDAIAERSGSNGALKRHLTRIADQMRAAKKSDEEIITTLTKWRDPDEDAA